MAFPPDDLCIRLPAIPEFERICLPGGVCLDYAWSQVGKIPTAADLSIDFLGQLGPALAPMQPFFNILDVVVQIFKCLQAIPDAITNLDPSELVDCIPALGALIDQLLKLIPQMSIPKLVIAAIRNVATLLRGIAGELSAMNSQLQRIADGIDRAASLGDAGLNSFLVCAQDTVQQSASATAAALKGIGTLILTINLFMGLFGGPEIPCFGALVEDNLSQGFDVIIDLLLSLADLLDDIADKIPDPDLALTLALGDRQC
jgi:hypothetical protein